MNGRRRNTVGVTGLALIGVAGLIGCSTKGNLTGFGDVSGNHLVVFASDRGLASGQYDVLLWDFDELSLKALPKLNSTAAERQPTISSDGRFIAFESDHGTGTQADIYMYDRLRDDFVDLRGLNTADPESEPAFTG